MSPEPHSSRRVRIWLGVILLAIGLLGHLLAANAEGGHAIHYRHHIFGFFLLTAITGIVIGVLGRYFWKGRHDITLLIVGALQTILGLLVYVSFSN
jgi:hypothetical protein